MPNYLKWSLLAAVLCGALWSAWQYAVWQRDRQEAAVVARAVKYAVEQFSPAYLDYVRKNRHGPRDNMDLGLPPPRDSLWVGLSRAELYPNGDVHFEYKTTDSARSPLLVWRIGARGSYLVAPQVCGARDIGPKVLEWNGLRCDANVAEPAADAPVPELAALSPHVAAPVDELLDAVHKDDPEQLNKLRQSGRDICAANPDNITPLAEAARGSQSKAITALLAVCDVNQVEPFSGKTPLMIAAAAHDVEISRALLMAGANPALRSEKSDSAWFLLGTSSDDNSQQIRNMFQVKGAAIDTLAADQGTLLMRAAAAGSSELVDWLLRGGARIDLQDKAGRSALMYAALSATGEPTLQLLISRHAQVNLADAEGKTALALAQGIADLNRQDRVIQILKSAGGRT